MRRYVVPLVVVALAIVAGFFVPWREVQSAAEFRFRPETAKFRHFQKFIRAGDNTTVFVLGTVHYQHVQTDRYPLWQLKSVITGLRPNGVIVEVRPEAIQAGAWGEGPIEMPFCAFVAKEAGIEVRGMDNWDKTFETRENKMIQNVLLQIPTGGSALVVTGFSHVGGFSRRLTKAGFKLQPWPDAEKRSLMTTDVAHTTPPGLREAYLAAAADAENGKSGYGKEWAQLRRALVAGIFTD